MNQSAIVKQVHWKDLTKLSGKETFIENTLTFPWLIASWILASQQLYFLALPCSVMFFLTALRQVHNAFHNSLGTSKKLTWLSLYLNSLLMLTSAHAVKFSHLRHHKYCLGEEDHEGKCAKMTWYGAILHGPMHIYGIHKIALTLGNRNYKRNTMLEMASIIIFITIAFMSHSNFLIYHCIVMAGGELLSAFFAVWTVHHDLEEHVIARTQRTWWKNFVTYNMFYHLEHHLFPAVPTIKLPELAKRIDEAIPDIEKRQTF